MSPTFDLHIRRHHRMLLMVRESPSRVVDSIRAILWHGHHHLPRWEGMTLHELE